MDLYTHCTSCKKDIKIKSIASTRPDLQMEKGEEFDVNCLSCGNLEKKHVNDIKAEYNNTLILIGVVIGAVVSIFLLNYFGIVGAIGTAIPILFWQQQMSAKKAFNSYMIRRK